MARGANSALTLSDFRESVCVRAVCGDVKNKERAQENDQPYRTNRYSQNSFVSNYTSLTHIS